MIVLGLTGSIGMGKTTCAAMFKRLGIPIHDADQQVRALTGPGGEAYSTIQAAFPYFEFPSLYVDDKKRGVRMIDRFKLAKLVFNCDDKRRRLENILHPLVRISQTNFIRAQQNMGQKLVVLDIPLLYETSGDNRVDYVAVASAPYHLQRQRVLCRPGMTEDKFNAILSKQIPDAEKCARADFIIQTGLGRAHSMKRVKEIVLGLKQSMAISNRFIN